MALVLTNGIFYIAESDNGSIEKVEEESKAKKLYCCMESGSVSEMCGK